jgi:AMP-polyphosphate phosphotransferase
MFEAAELERAVAKADYESEVASLRVDLLELQRRLERHPFPLIVLFGGVDAAGKSETVHLLNEWMDPRWIANRAFEAPSEEERERPPFWRFWLALPPRGRIGLFLSGWYLQPIFDRVHRTSSKAEFDGALDRIAAFERMLADEGAVIVKFWMHLDRKAQKKRLRALSRNPLTRWRVTRRQWNQWKRYDRIIVAAERLIQRTSVAHAPWIIVDASDERYRSLMVGTEIRRVLTGAFTRHERASSAAAATAAPRHRRRQTRPRDLVGRVDLDRSILDALDMTRALPKERFETQLLRQQGRVYLAQRRAQAKRRSIVLVFEGWDAAGKGGAIRRVASALDPGCYRVVPMAAPTDEERARHYLWRFWRHLSRAGRVTIFDRSWYGRVLVERVNGFASEPEWSRAYAEIEGFEEQLADFGIILVKYWLHITKEEQEKRFRERAQSPHKRWKLTEEDWRNRAKWDDYELAVNDMVARTSTRRAPWHLIPANDKNYARVEVLRLAADAIERAL